MTQIAEGSVLAANTKCKKLRQQPDLPLLVDIGAIESSEWCILRNACPVQTVAGWMQSAVTSSFGSG